MRPPFGQHPYRRRRWLRRPPAAPAAPAGFLRYAVVRYDSPWAIAAAHLGNGLRWKEILDESGATLVDGRGIVNTPEGPAVEDTARTIYPGQVLLLPPDATGLAPPPAPLAGPPPGPSADAAPPAPPQAPAPAAQLDPPPTTVWSGSIPAGPDSGTALGGAVRLTADVTMSPGARGSAARSRDG